MNHEEGFDIIEHLEMVVDQLWEDGNNPAAEDIVLTVLGELAALGMIEIDVEVVV